MQAAPPGIFDLIPCGPSLPHNHDDGFDLEPHIWSHLPDNLLHSILSLLPFRSVLRFRCVCKQWKALFASPAFHHFASHRAHVPPLIFFIGSCAPRDHNGIKDTFSHYDDGYGDNGPIHEKDDTSINTCAHDQEESDDNVSIEPLLLIFDCESESWSRPLVLPPAFNRTATCNFPYSLHVCTFQEQVLIPCISPFCFFLFNPASPPCKTLPPCIAIQSLETFGFAEERATLSDDVASPSLSDLVSMSNEKEARAQDKTAKFLHVVAVGDTVNDTNIVESFDSITGSWHVIGRLPQSDEFAFEQMRMIYCKGCFYALLCSGILMMSNVLVGKTMEWTFRKFPDPPNLDGDLSGRQEQLIDWHIVATRESVFLVGVRIITFLDTSELEGWNVGVWQFHPSAPANACWEEHAYVPTTLWDFFIGNTHVSTIHSLAHGNLIFFMVAGRRRFLIYDVSRKLWRLSAKCNYFLERMIFVWEPLIRN